MAVPSIVAFVTLKPCITALLLNVILVSVTDSKNTPATDQRAHVLAITIAGSFLTLGTHRVIIKIEKLMLDPRLIIGIDSIFDDV